MRLARFLLVSLLLGFCGCAANGPLFQDAPKPRDPNAVVLYAYRVGSPFVAVRMRINGEEAAKLDTSFTWFALEEGIYEFRMKVPALVDPLMSLKFEEEFVKAESPYYMRIVTSGNHISSELVTYAQAMNELTTRRYIEPTKVSFKAKMKVD